jgi:adenylate cyclase
MAIPIERQHLDETVRDGLAAGAEWIGRMASRSFDMEGIELPDEQNASLADIIDQTGTLDIGRLQELGEGMQSDDLAFTALVDQDGEIVLSDQLSLVGEAAPVYPEARVEEATWRDEAVWVASTPLRRGEDGEQIGSLRMAMRRERVDAFLDEARSLFWLAGLAAVLAGILLAQAIGGAAAAPVAELAAGARRIGQGDLGVRFRVEGRDELAALANAYNQMVEGLEEREWLRDMFGRFVSQEVAEAIRSGQVRLEGENRVVSVLFCDIRDFTGLSERYPPQEIVALLNQYLPVVVSAAAAHGGTVNKFGGDSTLVIYGAPRQLAESAYQAVLTALDMQRDLALLNEELTTRGYDPIRIGVGINTGEVLAGAVGPRERQEYTVIGDTVNLASRIEGLNKQFPEHSILVSQWTYEALGAHRGEFGLVDLGKVAIRGKSGKVGVWAVEAI